MNALQTWVYDHRAKFDFVSTVYNALMVVHAGLGVAILVGGSDRFPFPTHMPLLSLTDGAVWPWGVSILGSALLMALHGWWTNMLGLGLSLLWMNLFSAMFFVSYQYPTSSSTAPIPYAGFAMIVVALMTYKVVERRVRRKG